MPVPFAQITTIKEVYDYAVGSAQAAMTKCSSVSADYDNLASQIKDYVNQELAGNWNEFAGVARFKQEILDINEDCKKVAGSAPSVPVQPKSGVNVVPPGPGPQVVKAGFPWWIVLLLGGGALAYYLYSKKPGSSLSRGEHLVRKAKGKSKRRKYVRRKQIRRKRR